MKQFDSIKPDRHFCWGDPWPKTEKWNRLRLSWCILILLLGCCFVSALSLYWTARRYSGLLSAFSVAPMTVFLNLLPLILFVAVLYSLTGRSTLSLALPSLLLLALTLTNAIKINLRGDPLVASDLTLTGEAVGMLDRYGIVLSKSQIAGLIAIPIGLLLLSFLTGKIRLTGHWKLRCGIATGCTVVFTIMMLLVYPSNSLYKATYADNGVVTSRNATLWYSAHGFTYSFLHSVLDQSTVNLLFADNGTKTSIAISDDTFEDASSDATEISIIAIMLEAYCDVTDYLASDAIEDVYASFHSLQADGISGKLLVNTNGGGTIDSERSFITGYTSLTDFDTQTNSYIWYLRSLGYTTEGSHPNTGSYYNRLTVNSHLGYQNYFFSEGYYEKLLDLNYVTTRSDAALFDEIINLLEDNGDSSPYFSMNVSLQNHGPYDADACSGTEYLTELDVENETVRNIVNNYLNLIATTNQAISDMTERLNNMETPVILVLFGDHMPYWGDYTSLDYYGALGINADTSTDEGYYNYYSTPYLIWANSAARDALDNDCTGDGGDIGPYFLMNKVFALCGISGDSMMQASNKLLDAGITMVSSAVELYCENGELVEVLSEKGQTALDEFLAFQSKWQGSFIYGDID